MLDYFYGSQAEQFSFYRIPKALFTDERFRSISAEAKVLYGILLDRMSLSQKNGWLDDTDRVYIIFTTQDIMDAIDCADQKATKLLSELEQKAGLIERKRQGLGKPNLIYVKNFIGSSESRFKNRENHDVVILTLVILILFSSLRSEAVKVGKRIEAKRDKSTEKSFQGTSATRFSARNTVTTKTRLMKYLSSWLMWYAPPKTRYAYPATINPPK